MMTPPSTLRTALALGLALGGLSACRKPKADAAAKTKGFTAAQLLELGEGALKRKRWEEGRRNLRLVEEYFPSSPEFARAKLLLGDSYFFSSTLTYAEALVEYQSFLNYFPRHEMRDYALYRIALCHYAAIETAERDQGETRRAMQAFQTLLNESPGTPYATEAKAKIVQCWRRLAEHELLVGVFCVNSFHFDGAERRLKQLLETYPEYVDRERAYYYLGEALRRKAVPLDRYESFHKDFLARIGKGRLDTIEKAEMQRFKTEWEAFEKQEIAKYRAESKTFFQRLVESYPNSEWTPRAKDRLMEMGQTGIQEELDS